MRIREYQPADFDVLWRLDQECFAPGIAYSRFELMQYIRQPGAFTLVAEEDGDNSICGFGVAERAKMRRRPELNIRPMAGHVITIDVCKRARGCGVGTVLMEALEARLIQAGCELVYLEAAVDNQVAIRFYMGRGYTVLRTLPRYYHGDLDGLKMGKKLHPNPSRNHAAL